MKTCSRCKSELPLTAFRADSTKKSGYSSQCKDCKDSRSDKSRYRTAQVGRKYGLSREDYAELVEVAGGHCMICNRIAELVIDHCHATGEVRGLLCYSCNIGLGQFQDSPEVLEAAIWYLRSSSGKEH